MGNKYFGAAVKRKEDFRFLTGKGAFVDGLDVPSALNPIGVKGAGEVGTIGAPAAIANALEEALLPLGAKIREFPLTQNRIWELIVKHAFL